MTYDRSLELARSRVLPEWIDYNGHMNVAYYVLAFDQSLDSFCDRMDLGRAHVERTGNSIFVLETHVTYVQEVVLNDPLLFTLQMLDSDAKRFHYFIRMYHAERGYLAATSEQISLHVSLTNRRSTPMPPATAKGLADLAQAHRSLPRPEQAGHVIGIRHKPATANATGG